MKPGLIVIDCQNDFIKDSSPYSCQMLDAKLIQNIKSLIDFCRKRKTPIIYTQHSIKPDKSNAETGEPENIRTCIIGTKGWKIIKELKSRKGEAVVQKDRFDAFFNTNLENILRKLDVDSLIVSGVLTNNCVRATAEGAYYRGYKLILISDCCGATSYLPYKTHKEIHEITLKDLKERTYETKIFTLEGLKTNL